MVSDYPESEVTVFDYGYPKGECMRLAQDISVGARCFCCVLFLACSLIAFTTVRAQETTPAGPAKDGGQTSTGDVPASSEPVATDASAAEVVERKTGINLLQLILQGGWLMVPIVLMSALVITISIERFFGMRRARVLPKGLVAELGKLGGPQGAFDPRLAYRLCQQYPSAAASVVRTMLLKVGRPHSEVEHTVTEASQREAERMHGNVRWLTMAAAVTPLLGLFGTVWGMIRAFHDMTQLLPGQDKAEFLGKGIYVALVTTVSGLAVAIPAAILSHYFEGRIQYLFHRIDELVFSLMPQIERFEGRVRFGPVGESAGGDPSDGQGGAIPPVAPVAAKTPS